ncbi:MAG: anti-sigma factor [Pseudomonadota bacterium]
MTEKIKEPDDDRALAAEYVMGLISAQERRAVEARLGSDAAFAAQVSAWEAYFSGLNQDYGTVQAPKRAKTQIDKRLFRPKRWWVGSWVKTGLATAVTLAGLFVGVLAFNPLDDARLVAQLEGSEGTHSFAVSVDERSGFVDITLTTGDLTDDRVFELWVIADDGVPQSLGTFGQTGQFPDFDDPVIRDGTRLAVSLEPLGGSPTGLPTGSILASGVLDDV